MIAGPTLKFQEAGLSLPHSWLAIGFAIVVISHIDKNSIHPKRGRSNRNEVGLKPSVIYLLALAKYAEALERY